MTVAGSAAALTKAINETTKALDITEASLDAKVTAVQTSEAAAGADKTEAEGYRDEAAAHTVSVAGDLTTVQGNVTYQGISAILAEKAVTAVDVFVYDTSLDSDGGAWRKRCQHTSWYNEPLNTATRGARREFPAVAVIVLQAGKITVYDGDDPALPMWREMVGASRPYDSSLADVWWIGASSASSVTAINGVITCGQKTSTTPLYGGGLFIFSMIADKAKQRWRSYGGDTGYAAPSLASVVGGKLISHRLPAIISEIVHDIAMTVLPDAPVDPDTGLPVPTIAVATTGGVSVFRDDGNVWDITDSFYGQVTRVAFYGDMIYAARQSSAPFFAQAHAYKVPSADVAIIAGNIPASVGVNLGTGFFAPDNTAVGARIAQGQFGSVNGLRLIGGDPLSDDGRMLADVKSGFATGWMPGDIKGAFLADTDDTDLVEPTSIIPNGDFSSSDTFWAQTTNATVQFVSEQLEVTATADFGGVTPSIFLYENPGWYWVEADLVSGTGRFTFDFVENAGDFPNINRTAPYSFRGYVKLRSDGYFLPVLRTSVSGTTTVWDNLRMVKVDDDRSVNNKGLIVNGTITRSPVADGAELVGYSGFSAANYLEQPYNSDLDFGIGDFCVMGWAKESAASDWLVDRMEGRDGSNSLHGFNLWQNTQSLRFDVYENNSATSVLATTVMGSSDPLWYFFAAVRRKGALEMYINGVLEAITNGPDRNTNYTGVGAPPPLTIGARAPDGGASWLNGHAALIRISATAPTPNQIGKIYEDERRLFMPGAQCTLYGTSDAVTALAHDPKTNLLHVGTSAGRSVFDGLQPVAHTETPVTTAISAAGGLIVEE